jgi:hypothetical protein
MDHPLIRVWLSIIQCRTDNEELKARIEDLYQNTINIPFPVLDRGIWLDAYIIHAILSGPLSVYQEHILDLIRDTALYPMVMEIDHDSMIKTGGLDD